MNLMMLSEITKIAGGCKRRKRVGRGESSGTGKTAGRGHKGCLSRSGGGPHPLSEGGQMPIFRRLPKRGFSNFNFRNEFEIVNVSQLEHCFADGDTVDFEVLKKLRLVQESPARVKILAKGKLGKKLTVQAHAFSKKARQVIEDAGGKIELLEQRDPAAAARAKRKTAQSRSGEPKATRLEKKKKSATAQG
jgi:large subunit ribosomal protein L15